MTLKRFLLTAAALASAPALLHAFTISGRITEHISGDALPMATYHVYLPTDTVHPIVNNITDDNGIFREEMKSAGRYIFTAEYAGKRTARMELELTDEKPDVSLGNIALLETGHELAEVTVVSRKDLISSDGSKLTYDVERDPSAGTNTVIEMLRKVPMVTVDGEDNIKVKGSSNFRIYINGKEDPMLTGDPKSVLKSMPASSIKKIEVITDPGAKFEAEGSGGILNIITDRKQTIEGYMLTLRGGISSRGFNGSLYGRTKINKVTVAGSLYGSKNNIFNSHSYATTQREDYTSDDNYEYRTNTRFMNKSKYLGGNLNMSWEADSLNLFTLSLSGGQYDSRSLNDGDISMRNRTGDLQWMYRRDFSTDSNDRWLSANASYQHTFPGNTAHTLTLSYQYNWGDSPYHSEQRLYDGVNFDGVPYMQRHRQNYSDSHIMQVDYALPLVSNKHTFEAGGKAVLRPHQKATQSLGTSIDGITYTEDSYMNVSQFNDVYALYTSYTANFWRMTARAGLRYEHTRLGMEYHKMINTGDYPDFTTHLNDFVPNAALTYKLTDLSNLRLAYSMRISRPGINSLNPYRNTMTYGEVSYGNPDLTSEHSNSVELKYSNYGGDKLTGEMSISYRQNNDMVASYSFIKDGMYHTTYGNIGRDRYADLDGYLAYQITPTMDASIYGSLNYEDVRSDKSVTPIRNHGWATYFNLNYGYTMPCKLRLDAWGGGGTPDVNLQGRPTTGWYYYGISLSRSFLKDDALNISVTAQDFFQNKKKWAYNMDTPNMHEHSSSRYQSWSVGLSVSYRLGKLRSDVKRTAAQVGADDVTNGKSGNSAPR